MKAKPIREARPSPLFTLLRTDEGRRVHYPVVNEPGAVEGRFVTVVSRVQPAAQNLALIHRMERHPHGSQSFIPLSVGRWLLAICPETSDGAPDIGQLSVFALGAEDAVCLHRNSWHVTLTVFDVPAEIIMMMWRSMSGRDTEYFDLPQPFAVQI